MLKQGKEEQDTKQKNEIKEEKEQNKESKEEIMKENEDKDLKEELFKTMVKIQTYLSNTYELFSKFLSLINKEFIKKGCKNLENGDIDFDNGINIMDYPEPKINKNKYNDKSNNFLNRKTKREQGIDLDENTDGNINDFNFNKKEKNHRKKQIQQDGYLSTVKKRKNKNKF